MAGANMNGLQKVFGDDASKLTRIKTCEFHFKESRNKMARKLNNEDANVFKELCVQMLASSLQATYQNTKRNLEEFIEAKSERQILNSWIKWWDSRRVFIFSAFAPKNAPKMNLAEVIHAGWSNRHSPNLSLLDAAQIDAKDSIFLGAELKSIEKGSSVASGQGPSFQQKKAKSHHQELARAAQLGKDIVTSSDFQIDPNSGHRPPLAKKPKHCNKKNTKKRNEQSSSQQPSTSSQDAHTFTQQPSAPTPTHVIQLHNTTDFGPAQVGTKAMTDPSQHLSDPGPSNQSLYCPSHFQPQQQHFSSTLSKVRPPAVATPCPNICHLPLSQRQPAGFGAPYVSQQTTQGSWHSGHSPYRYELIELPSKVKKCYGCGLEFSEKFRQSPHNIVVKHVDRRLVRRDEKTGQFQYSADFSNTYYHLDGNHIARKNPVFDGNVYLPISSYQVLDSGQHHVISTSNVNIVLI